MAFVVPAEIGHAPYAVPLLNFLCDNFGKVQLILIRDSVFEQLSQDVWLLYAEGRGETTDKIEITLWERFRSTTSIPRPSHFVTTKEWKDWGFRLRPFILSSVARELYCRVRNGNGACRLGDSARVGIGYVTGDNSFFHLRPSEAESAKIPRRFLIPTVRSGRVLNSAAVDQKTVSSWNARNEPYLLLHLRLIKRFQRRFNAIWIRPWECKHANRISVETVRPGTLFLM